MKTIGKLPGNTQSQDVANRFDCGLRNPVEASVVVKETKLPWLASHMITGSSLTADFASRPLLMYLEK